MHVALALNMSLYYETAKYIINTDRGNGAGSLKTRIFGQKDTKCPPKQIFALATEATRWSEVLSEVIEKTQLLQHERKVRDSVLPIFHAMVKILTDSVNMAAS